MARGVELSLSVPVATTIGEVRGRHPALVLDVAGEEVAAR